MTRTLALLLCALSFNFNLFAAEPTADELKPLLGYWKNVQSDQDILRLEPHRITNRLQGQLVFILADVTPTKLVMYDQGRKKISMLSFKDGVMTCKPESGAGDSYVKMDAPPAGEMDILPLKIGDDRPVASEKVAAVRAELTKRLTADQSVRTDPAKQAQKEAVDDDNIAWLSKTVQELGWIDVRRFGEPAASAAFVILQHSHDLPLIMAALPFVEKDLKAGLLTDGSVFVMLYDLAQEKLGRRQKYGTQMVTFRNMEAMLIQPLEDKNRLDDFRREVHVGPYAQYREQMEKQSGRKSKFSDE